MDSKQEVLVRKVTGGVDTHKDLHVAAIVDEHNGVLGSEFFSTTRHGYKQMITWMRTFGTVERIGVECTGSYGAGLLRYLQPLGIEVLEVTAPDKTDRRKRGKNDTIDAENAAHAAFAGIRTVTPKTRDGLVESLRVLKVGRKHGQRLITRRHAKDETIAWLLWYNQSRLHSTLNYVSPMQFEQHWLTDQTKQASS